MAFFFGILSYFVRKSVYDYSETTECTEEATGVCAGINNKDKRNECMKI